MEAVVHNFNEHNADKGLIIDRSRAVSGVIVEVGIYKDSGPLSVKLINFADWLVLYFLWHVMTCHERD